MIIHFANGSRFKGMYKKGLRNGPAIEEDKDGKRFEGVYADGLRNGRFLEKTATEKLSLKANMNMDEE